MKISRVTIKNFRCFKEIEINFESLTVLIGENNIGKTTVLTALDKILGFGRTYFEENDFYMPDEKHNPRESEPITIEVELVPSGGEENFSEEEDAVFGNEYFIGNDETVCLRIRAKHWYDKEEEDYKTDVCFVKEDTEYGSFTARHKKALCFYLAPALRDIEREVVSRRGILARLLGKVDLGERTEIEVEDLSRRINEALSSDPSIADFQEDLRDTISKVIPLLDDPSSVALKPLPLNPYDILKDSGIFLHIAGQPAPQSILAQGAGSQSILILAIFEAYVKKLGVQAPILGVEEPEAHLHPHAQRYVFRYLANKPNQVLLSTHSTFITDQADPFCIRLLIRSANRILVRSIPRTTWMGRPFLDAKEREKLIRTLNAEGSELFFARAVILVEGPSEKHAYPLFAQAIGMDFDRRGISVLKYEGDDFYIFGKILGAHALGIPYVVQTDGEEATIKKAARRLVKLGIISREDFTDRRDNTGSIVKDLLIPNNVFPLWKDNNALNFETYMLSRPKGVGIYMRAIEEIHGLDKLEKYIRNRGDLNWDDMSDEEKIIEFIGSREVSKPALAQYVAKEYINENPDRPVPVLFKRVIRRAIELSD